MIEGFSVGYVICIKKKNERNTDNNWPSLIWIVEGSSITQWMYLAEVQWNGSGCIASAKKDNWITVPGTNKFK